MSKGGLIIGNAEDGNVRWAVKKTPCRIFTFGLKEGDFQAKNVTFRKDRSSFDVYLRDRFLATFKTKLAGFHNVRNCLAAIATAYHLKVGLPIIIKAVESFLGTSRRFEIVGRARGVTVIDDYAHHPTKARETIAASRRRFPNSRLFAVYVPHTYTRTKALLREYGQAFNEASFVIIPDIEPARERHLEALVNSQDLVREIGKAHKNVYYMSSPDEISRFICEESQKGDVVLCMSVRGFNNFARRLINYLKETNPR